MVAAASGVKGEGASKVTGRAGAKVTVASKLPMALELQLSEKRSVRMRNGNNAWDEDVYTKSGPIVTIAGNAYPQGSPPEGMPDKPMMTYGAALTFGVDKDFFDRWLDQNKDTPMVRNNMVFAHERAESVKARAREHVKELSGLGPLTPDNDRRMPKKLITGRFAKRDEVADADDMAMAEE